MAVRGIILHPLGDAVTIVTDGYAARIVSTAGHTLLKATDVTRVFRVADLRRRRVRSRRLMRATPQH